MDWPKRWWDMAQPHPSTATDHIRSASFAVIYDVKEQPTHRQPSEATRLPVSFRIGCGGSALAGRIGEQLSPSLKAKTGFPASLPSIWQKFGGLQDPQSAGNQRFSIAIQVNALWPGQIYF